MILFKCIIYNCRHFFMVSTRPTFCKTFWIIDFLNNSLNHIHINRIYTESKTIESLSLFNDFGKSCGYFWNWFGHCPRLHWYFVVLLHRQDITYAKNNLFANTLQYSFSLMDKHLVQCKDYNKLRIYYCGLIILSSEGILEFP